MRCRGKHVVNVRDLDATWNLYVLSDVHLGNAGCALNRFRWVVSQIEQDDNCGVMLLGDQTDSIAPGDPRFDATCIDTRSLAMGDLGDLGEALTDAFYTEIEPIRAKIIGACMGNHERKLMQKHSQGSLHARFCKRVGCLDMGISGFVDLVFTDANAHRSTYRVWAHHGAGGALTPGGKINRLIRFMDMVESDIVLTGHTHESLDYTRTRLAANRACTTVTQVPQLGVVCGTYLRTYTQDVIGYGEDKGYHPTSIGSPAIEIVPGQRMLGVRWLRG